MYGLVVSTRINVTSIDPGLVNTEFSTVRFGGDADRAAKVYEGVDALTGSDVAETIVFGNSIQYLLYKYY
jgi:3-hydroxy acid dehydrogenase / malonic semialdehyde reductase